MVDPERLKSLALVSLSSEEQAFLQVAQLIATQPDQFAVTTFEDGDFGKYLSLVTDLLPSKVILFVPIHSLAGTHHQDFHLFDGTPGPETRLYYQGAWGGVDAINRYNELKRRLPDDPLGEVTFNFTDSPVFLETKNSSAESRITKEEALSLLQNSTCRLPREHIHNMTLADILSKAKSGGSIPWLRLVT